MKISPGDMVAAFKRGDLTYRDEKVYPCCDCSGLEVVDGEWATGEELPSGYTPKANELVRIHSITCTREGLKQVS